MSAVLADFLVLTPVSDEDLALAANAIRVHVSEPWPQGQLCHSERVPYPCRLARWVQAAGRTEEKPGEPA